MWLTSTELSVRISWSRSHGKVIFGIFTVLSVLPATVQTGYPWKSYSNKCIQIIDEKFRLHLFLEIFGAKMVEWSRFNLFFYNFLNKNCGRKFESFFIKLRLRIIFCQMIIECFKLFRYFYLQFRRRLWRPSIELQGFLHNK